MDSEATGPAGDYEIQGILDTSPSPDVTKRVDALFSAASHDPHDLEDWLAALQEAAGMKWTTGNKKIRESSENDDGLTSNPGLSQRGSWTRISLPEQLDHSLLEQFRKLQAVPDDNRKEPSKCDVQLEMNPREPSRPLQRHSAGEIHRIPPRYNSQPTEQVAEHFFKNIWTHHLSEIPNGRELYLQPPTPPYYMLPIRCRSRPRRTSNLFCAFCFKNKEHLQAVTSHNLYFPKSSIVCCPVLRNYVCRCCGATGDGAHTDSYCPLRKGHPKAKGQQVEANVKGIPKKQITSHWYQDNFPPLTPVPK